MSSLDANSNIPFKYNARYAQISLPCHAGEGVVSGLIPYCSVGRRWGKSSSCRIGEEKLMDFNHYLEDRCFLSLILVTPCISVVSVSLKARNRKLAPQSNAETNKHSQSLLDWVRNNARTITLQLGHGEADICGTKMSEQTKFFAHNQIIRSVYRQLERQIASAENTALDTLSIATHALQKACSWHIGFKWAKQSVQAEMINARPCTHVPVLGV